MIAIPADIHDPIQVDEWWMNRALAMARLGAMRGEVPIGCVIVRDGRLISASHDGKEVFQEPSAHAEMIALRRAARREGGWRLDGAWMYVTLEPCPMCAGAILHARIKRLVTGPSNPRWGACTPGVLDLLDEPRFNHRVEVVRNVLEERSASLLRETFRQYRLDRRDGGAGPAGVSIKQ